MVRDAGRHASRRIAARPDDRDVGQRRLLSQPVDHDRASATQVTASNLTMTAGPAPAHPSAHRGAVHLQQDDRDHRRGRFRQRPGHQRAGAVLRSGDAAAGVARRQGEEGTGAGDRRLAGLRAGHQRLSQGTRHRQERAPAGRHGQGPRPARRRRSARGAAGSDRRGQCRGRPRCGAAGTRVAGCRSARRSGDLQAGRPVARIEGTHPLTDRRHRGGKTDHARSAAAGRQHALLHRGRSVAGVGDGASLRFRTGVGQRRRSGGSADRHRPRTTLRGTVANISAR